jgi:hypothetical protein
VVQVAAPAALHEQLAQAFRSSLMDAFAEAGSPSAAGSVNAAAFAALPRIHCFAQLPYAGVCFLAGLVFAAEGADTAPCSGMVGAFTAAVLRRPDCQQSLLPALLKEPLMRSALAARPPVPAAVQLAQARTAYLELRVLRGIPKDDFSMPFTPSLDPKVCKRVMQGRMNVDACPADVLIDGWRNPRPSCALARFCRCRTSSAAPSRSGSSATSTTGSKHGVG